MGYIKHNAIICTAWNKESVIEAKDKAKEIFSSNQEGSSCLVSEIVEYIVNEGYSFFIAPDGSKEGWDDSNNCDTSRKEFTEWLDNSDNYCDYIEVRFGGDDDDNKIVSTN